MGDIWKACLTLFLPLVLIGGVTGHGATVAVTLCFILLMALPVLLLAGRINDAPLPAIAAALLLGIAFHLLIGGLISLVSPISIQVHAAISVFLGIIAAVLHWRSIVTDLADSCRLRLDEFCPAIGASLSIFCLALIFLTVGNEDGDVRQYTAYFDADGFKHLAYAWSAFHHGLPVVDPFGNGAPLPYYWLYYVLPAQAHYFVSMVWPGEMIDTLFGVSLVISYLLLVVVFGLLREMGVNSGVAAALTFLVFLSPSLDGLAHFANYQGEAIRLSSLVDLDGYNLFLGPFVYLTDNPDFHVYSSTLFRMMLFGWQHALAVAFFVSWAYLAISPTLPARFSCARHILVLPLIATSTLTGMAALPAYLLSELVLAVWGKKSAYHYLLPVFIFILAFSLPLVLGMFDGDLGRQTATSIALDGGRRIIVDWAAMVVSIFGPVADMSPAIFWAVLGCVVMWRARMQPRKAHLVAWATTLAALGMFVFTDGFVQDEHIRKEIELKVSFIVALGIWMIAGLAFNKTLQYRRGKIVGLVLLVLGLLTPAFNIVFFTTQHEKITVGIPKADEAAFAWIRKNTSPQAVFLTKSEAVALRGGRDTWIPIFAGRTVAISHRDANDSSRSINSKDLDLVFEQADGAAVERIADELSVDYIYLSRAIHQPSYMQIRDYFASQTGWSRIYGSGDSVAIFGRH